MAGFNLKNFYTIIDISFKIFSGASPRILTLKNFPFIELQNICQHFEFAPYVELKNFSVLHWIRAFYHLFFFEISLISSSVGNMVITFGYFMGSLLGMFIVDQIGFENGVFVPVVFFLLSWIIILVVS